MGTEIRKQSSALVTALLASPKKFSFAQAVRLLALHARDEYGSELAFLKNGLKIIPELTLGHPSTDLAAAKALEVSPKERFFTAESLQKELISIEEEAAAAKARFLEQAPSQASPEISSSQALLPFTAIKTEPSYELTATFLALYGTASPLPTFYTEELIEEARLDRSGSRDFLDIFNQALYTLYYRAFQHYKLSFRTLEQQDNSVLQMQYCLLGLGSPALREAAHANHADLKFINLFLRRHRSAHALCLGLRLQLGIENIFIEECVLCKVPVPKDQLCRLGTAQAQLGEAVVGEHVFDKQGKFRIHLKELTLQHLHDLSPKGILMQKLHNFLQQYLPGTLEYDVVLYAKKNIRVRSSYLGNGTHQGQNKSNLRLGQTAFLHNPSRSIPRVQHYFSRYSA